MAHHCRTSNALDTSVCCLRTTFKTVSVNDRMTENVKQWVPDRRTSHREGPRHSQHKTSLLVFNGFIVSP